MNAVSLPSSHAVAGLLLAAGAGRRAGGPKALRVDHQGKPWVRRAAALLLDSGCRPVVVTVGCRAIAVTRALTGLPVQAVQVPDWHLGLASSLRGGLQTVLSSTAGGVMIHLVDLPDVGIDVLRRVRVTAGTGERVLARATFHGRPGHPVVMGRAHIQAAIPGLTGDSGAAAYLQHAGALEVRCEDLADGTDLDV